MDAPVAIPNSTNVRRTVLLALAVWGAAVFEGLHDGVLAKLAHAELVALALFALAYAPATYLLDRDLRAAARTASGFIGKLAIIDVALAFIARAACTAPESWFELTTTPGFGSVVFFVAPLVLTLHVAAVDRWLSADRSFEPTAGRPLALKPGVEL